MYTRGCTSHCSSSWRRISRTSKPKRAPGLSTCATGWTPRLERSSASRRARTRRPSLPCTRRRAIPQPSSTRSPRASRPTSYVELGGYHRGVFLAGPLPPAQRHIVEEDRHDQRQEQDQRGGEEHLVQRDSQDGADRVQHLGEDGG